jgi:hypothetical protein
LVFQSIENIFAITAIAIELALASELPAKRSGENGIFVDLARAYFDERELLLTSGLVDRGYRKIVFDPPPRHDHSALPAPAIKPQYAFPGLPPLPGIHPRALRGHPLDHAFDFGSQAQLEQIR